MKNTVLSTIALLLLMSLPAQAVNQLIFTDHFDDGVLDPAWEISFANANAWDFDESLTQPSYLTVRDITENQVGTGQWSVVYLTREIPPISDFHIEAFISWDDTGPPGSNISAAIHALRVDATNSANDFILDGTGYFGAWGHTSGSMYSQGTTSTGGTFLFNPPSGTLPFIGNALIEMDRVGSAYTFSWNGVEVFSSTIIDTDIEKIRLRFQYFSYPPVASHVGTLAIDYITVEGTLTTVQVEIDIKPGSETNCFNLNGHGVIPVAILGEPDFDVYNINTDPNAANPLSFNGLNVRVRGNKGPLCSTEDVNADGYLDLVCHFEDDPAQWLEGIDENATLTGELLDGTFIEGTDSICIVP